MKIRPVILCGGSGTRLWPNQKKHIAKQFIDFGGWNLFEKALIRCKSSLFDYPIISTNLEYLKSINKILKKHKINKYKIILEPFKKNTAPAILSTALIKDIPLNQPMMIFTADHLIEKISIFNKAINYNKKYLTDKNVFVFGIKPKNASTEFGYFLTKKKGEVNKVTKFIEKPKLLKAKQIIRNNGYWNSGMFYLRKDSIINNFKKYKPLVYKNCLKSVINGRRVNKVYYLNRNWFSKATAKSFDYAILEKTKDINAIKLDIPWSDLGSWREISKIFNRDKAKYFNKKNIYYRPWGRYVNLFEGKGFLVKELYVKSKSSISLQKHHHRSEHWLVTQGKPLITINKDKFNKKVSESVFIPQGAIHRIENPYKEPVKILEIQTGSILKETDIVRYQDIYGRVK
tara:strand:+ start:838 stop:2040 length:1203 start_codon:yes stop_codon:yes gene_type:complete